MKSGKLNFVEPSGPLQACNGTPLPFTRNALRRLRVSQKSVEGRLHFAAWRETIRYFESKERLGEITCVLRHIIGVAIFLLAGRRGQ